MSFRPEFRWVMSFHFTSGAQTLGLFAAAFLSCSSSFAGRLATQTVTFSVNAIDEIDLTGNPGAMTVSIATAGAPPNTVTDNSTRYAITTNGENRKITAMINHGDACRRCAHPGIGSANRCNKHRRSANRHHTS